MLIPYLAFVYFITTVEDKVDIVLGYVEFCWWLDHWSVEPLGNIVLVSYELHIFSSFWLCKVKKGQTLKTERKMSQILSKNKDLIPQIKHRQLNQHNSKLTQIFVLPKIHRNGIPLRPIVSNRGSACYPLSRFLVEIIVPLKSKSSSYVKNSALIVDRISDATIHSNHSGRKSVHKVNLQMRHLLWHGIRWLQIPC